MRGCLVKAILIEESFAEMPEGAQWVCFTGLEAPYLALVASKWVRRKGPRYCNVVGKLETLPSSFEADRGFARVGFLAPAATCSQGEESKSKQGLSPYYNTDYFALELPSSDIATREESIADIEKLGKPARLKCEVSQGIFQDEFFVRAKCCIGPIKRATFFVNKGLVDLTEVVESGTGLGSIPVHVVETGFEFSLVRYEHTSIEGRVQWWTPNSDICYVDESQEEGAEEDRDKVKEEEEVETVAGTGERRPVVVVQRFHKAPFEATCARLVKEGYCLHSASVDSVSDRSALRAIFVLPGIVQE